MAMLEVEDLNVRFYTEDGVVKATNDLSYQVEAGERFGSDDRTTWWGQLSNARVVVQAQDGDAIGPNFPAIDP